MAAGSLPAGFYRRLVIALLIAVSATLICYQYQERFQRGGGDFGWTLFLIHELQAGRDPYGYPESLTPMAYPLTAVLFAFPFIVFPPNLAGALFIGLSSGLLAFGLTRDQAWWRLLVLLSFPFWHALQTVQWSPLLMAVALYPVLLPITLAKPHVGFPVAVTRLTWRRVVACALFGLASLAIYPTWPWGWLGHMGAPGQYLPPLIVLPLGPLLLLALLHWRQERARFLFLMACVPQRLFYDQLLLWLVPSSPRELLTLTFLSWATFGAWFFNPAPGPLWTLALLYLPLLAMVLWQGRRGSKQLTIEGVAS